MASSFTRTKKSKSLDISDPATREALTKALGVEEKQPANVLERLTSAFSAFEPANAVSKATEVTLAQGQTPFAGLIGASAGAGQYLSDIVQGVSGAFTGDVNRDKKTFSDVLEQLGVENDAINSI